MNAPLIVRDLQDSELDALLALYAHLHSADSALPDRAELEAVWQTIRSDPALIYLGGFVGDVLVAACNAVIVPNLTRGARPYAVIENVVTHAEHRRRGHGAAVMRALLERCWQRRCYKIMLMSAMQRAEIHAFYVALGFDGDKKQAFVINAP